MFEYLRIPQWKRTRMARDTDFPTISVILAMSAGLYCKKKRTAVRNGRVDRQKSLRGVSLGRQVQPSPHIPAALWTRLLIYFCSLEDFNFIRYIMQMVIFIS